MRLHCSLVVVGALSCAFSPLAAQPPPEAGRHARAATPTDTLIDVGGHRLHLHVYRGRLPVTVLFEAGGAADLDSWDAVPARLAERTEATVVAYDRAGLGASDLGPMDLTPQAEVEDVREALAHLDLPPQTVVVGHSYGAMYALAHAAMFPGRVEGLTLVDPTNPRFLAEVGDWVESTVPDTANPRTNRDHVVRRMMRNMDSLSSILRISEPELDAPMAIISAGRDWWGSPEVDAAWRRSHEAMAAVSAERRRQVSEGSAHDIPGQDPETVVSAILRLLARASGPN